MTTPGNPALHRLVRCSCAVVLLAAVLFICIRIVGSGYVPQGDARRHVARAFAEKPFRDIVVMKSFYVVDHSIGWEALLRLVRRVTGCSEDVLMSFSIFSLLALLLAVPMFFLRRPEAWLAAVLAQVIALPELPVRWTQARPFLLTLAILICLLIAWSRPSSTSPSPLKLVATFLAFTLSVWMHGAWYLWILLPAAFCLARQWRAAMWLTICWLAGVIAGGLLTGHPVAFLKEQILIAHAIRSEHVPSSLLVGEFQPHDGEFPSLLLFTLVYLWGAVRKTSTRPLALQPAFWLLVIGWTLGFVADRFWADWGLPAGLVWMALQFEDSMAALWPTHAVNRLMACCAIAVPLCLDTTNDLDHRYSGSLHDSFVDASFSELKGWLPDTNGIFYSAQMRFFYDTFYLNPRADWRYILGFEPALMPDDDLRILRNIQYNRYAASAYEPWIHKLRPIDRLAVESPSEPPLPELEWKHASATTWIGRLRKSAVTPKARE